MLILALLLATPTLPVIEGGLPVDTDYPRIREMDRAEGSVTVRLLISPSGRAVRCGLLRPSGTKELDGTTCAVFLKRTRFNPARDAEGQATYAEIEVPVTWRLFRSGGTRREELPPLYDFTVARLPGGSGPVRVELILSIDAKGGLAGCAPMEPGNRPATETAPVELRAAACGALSAGWTALPVVNEAGTPTAYVRRAEVRFSQ